MVDFTWHAQDGAPVALMLVTTALYGLYHYFFRADSWVRRRGWEPGGARSFVAGKLAGAVLLGAIPAVVAAVVWSLGPVELGLNAGNALAGLGLAGGALVVLVPVIALQARRPAHQARHPLIRVARFDRRTVLTTVAGWVAYLVGYELFFRGFVLLLLVSWLGVWPGLAAMTALYTFAHLDKDAGEALGCIPMGFVFGGLALYTGSLLGPVVLHVGIAVSADLFAVRFSDERAFG